MDIPVNSGTELNFAVSLSVALRLLLLQMVAGAADGAELPAAGLPTDRQHQAHESRRHFGRGLAAAAVAAAGVQSGVQCGMEAAVHNAVIAAGRPAAGKTSGVGQWVQSTGQGTPRKSLSMGALRAQQRSRVADQDRTDDGERQHAGRRASGGLRVYPAPHFREGRQKLKLVTTC